MMLLKTTIFILLFFTQQIANEAAPLSIEIIHHNEAPAKVTKSKIEIDDNLVQDLVSKERMKDEATQTDPIPDNPEANVDYGAYFYDCAVPLPPYIVDYEIQERDIPDVANETADLQVRQTDDSPGPSFLESTIANINGVALNVMSLIFNSVGIILPDRTSSYS